MRTLFLRLPCSPSLQSIIINSEGSEHELIKIYVAKTLELPDDSYWLDWKDDNYVSVRLRLLGGKGGFGSNLRAQGNKMSSKKRQIGNESCRDLSGQRLRTINQTKLISEYLRKRPELERKREAEIREKMLKAIEAPNRKPMFSDVEYLRTARETVDMVETAVYDALLANNDTDDELDSNHNDKDKDKGKEKLTAAVIASNDGAGSSQRPNVPS